MLKSIKQWSAMVALTLIGMVAMAQESPEQVIRDTSDKMIAALQKDKAALQANPDRIYGLVEQILVPRFDFETISQWTMGRTWREATPDQRQRFSAEFKRLLINAYAGVLLEYTDEKINIRPLPQGAASQNDVTVRTEIVSSKRNPVAINYSMTKSGSRWLVYDVVVEGVSIVKNYRSEVRELVDSQGIDGMINTLKMKNKQ